METEKRTTPKTAPNTFITDPMLDTALAECDDIFDSHTVIQTIMAMFPKEYTEELYTHVGAQDPIETYHGNIGKRLGTHRDLQKTRRVRSMNVRGKETENQEWKKN